MNAYKQVQVIRDHRLTINNNNNTHRYSHIFTYLEEGHVEHQMGSLALHEELILKVGVSQASVNAPHPKERNHSLKASIIKSQVSLLGVLLQLHTRQLGQIVVAQQQRHHHKVRAHKVCVCECGKRVAEISHSSHKQPTN